MKWFSLKNIFKEIGKIRWPKKNDLAVSSVQVIVVIIFYAAFFYGCQFLVTLILDLLGVM